MIATPGTSVAARATAGRPASRRPSARSTRPRARASSSSARRTVVVAAGALRTPVDPPGLGPRASGHRPAPAHPSGAGHRRPSSTSRSRCGAGTMQGARSLEFLGPEPGRNGYVIESAPGHPGLLALALPWEGTDAHAESMARTADHSSPLIAVTRDGGEGRVSLTKSGGVRIDYALDATGIATLRHAARVAWRAWPGPPGRSEILAAGTPPRWFEPAARGSADAGRGVRGVRGRARQVRLRAEPRSVFFRPPDGHGADGRGRRATHPATRPAVCGLGTRRSGRRAGCTSRDASLFPTGHRGQPDDHGDGAGAARRPTVLAET